jgi:hypothetical protein
MLYYFLDENGLRTSELLTLSPASAVVPLSAPPDKSVAIRCRATVADDICYFIEKNDGTDESVADINAFADYIPESYASTIGKVYE